jgi:hypothetical protein
VITYHAPFEDMWPVKVYDIRTLFHHQFNKVICAKN